LSRDFLVADGIESVQVDRLGQILVGYFDEGIFGNCGWNTPLGRTGLCCFNDGGQKIWEFEAPPDFDQIADRYALNVSRDEVWFYYYSEFPIARIGSDWRVQCWSTDVAGARALAIRDRKALLYGVTPKVGQPARRAVCGLVAEVSLDPAPGFDLSRATVIGRDTDLHVFWDDDWHRYSLGSLS
jgi:hypothetical protein